MNEDYTVQDAILEVESRWAPGAAYYLECEKASILRDAIEEYEWGWVFCFVPDCGKAKRSKFVCAFDKNTRKIAPVGTRGLPYAISKISKT